MAFGKEQLRDTMRVTWYKKTTHGTSARTGVVGVKVSACTTTTLRDELAVNFVLQC